MGYLRFFFVTEFVYLEKLLVCYLVFHRKWLHWVLIIKGAKNIIRYQDVWWMFDWSRWTITTPNLVADT